MVQRDPEYSTVHQFKAKHLKELESSRCLRIWFARVVDLLWIDIFIHYLEDMFCLIGRSIACKNHFDTLGVVTLIEVYFLILIRVGRF